MPLISSFSRNAARAENHIPNENTYAIGATILSYGWSPSGNIAGFIAYGNIYPEIWTVKPYFLYGGGGADSAISATLASGYICSTVYQGTRGTFTYSPPYTQTGGDIFVGVGGSVTQVGYLPVLGNVSDNGGSSITITYVGK